MKIIESKFKGKVLITAVGLNIKQKSQKNYAKNL